MSCQTILTNLPFSGLTFLVMVSSMVGVILLMAMRRRGKRREDSGAIHRLGAIEEILSTCPVPVLVSSRAPVSRRGVPLRN